ncbi:MAG TPA: hypothetical protein VHA74_00835, partial [Candidatus Dojkabacteria bacterium]|nr:hypothetical protein [Candidatus Dojkabacteria bacterium]
KINDYTDPVKRQAMLTVKVTANWLDKFGELLKGQGGNPFNKGAEALVENDIKINSDYVAGGNMLPQELTAALSSMRVEYNKATAGQQFENIHEGLREALSKAIREQITEEYINGDRASQRPHEQDQLVIDLFTKGKSNLVVGENNLQTPNDEMVDSFVQLVYALNDKKLMQPDGKLNTEGAKTVKSILEAMLQRDDNWLASADMAFGRVIDNMAGSNYRGIPFVVTSALYRTAMELSGYEVDGNIPDIQDFIDNADQITRSGGYIKADSPLAVIAQFVFQKKSESSNNTGAGTPTTPDVATPEVTNPEEANEVRLKFLNEIFEPLNLDDSMRNSFHIDELINDLNEQIRPENTQTDVARVSVTWRTLTIIKSWNEDSTRFISNEAQKRIFVTNLVTALEKLRSYIADTKGRRYDFQSVNMLNRDMKTASEMGRATQSLDFTRYINYISDLSQI